MAQAATARAGKSGARIGCGEGAGAVSPGGVSAGTAVFTTPVAAG